MEWNEIIIVAPTIFGVALSVPALMLSYYMQFANWHADKTDFLLGVVLYFVFGFVTIPLTIIVGIPYLLAKLSKSYD